MITTLSTYKEMIMASSGEKSHHQLRKGRDVETGSANPPALLAEPDSQISAGRSSDAFSVDFSASHDLFSAVDDYFNLGRSGRFDAFHSLSPEDKEQFVMIVAELAKSGYIGYEELIVNKKVERHEITSQIGDSRLRNARIYDDPKAHRR